MSPSEWIGLGITLLGMAAGMFVWAGRVGARVEANKEAMEREVIAAKSEFVLRIEAHERECDVLRQSHKDMMDVVMTLLNSIDQKVDALQNRPRTNERGHTH